MDSSSTMSTSKSDSLNNNNTANDICIVRLSSSLRSDLTFLETSIVEALQFTLAQLNDSNCSLESLHRVPADEVLQQWSFYLGSKLPKTPWMALWREHECDDVIAADQKTPQVANQSSVYVDVVRIELDSLTALIEVLTNDEQEEMINEQFTVSLFELYPIRDDAEEKSVVAAFESAGVALDVARFFFKHVWMPWDEWDDESEDWANEHLSDRIALIRRRMEEGPKDIVFTQWQRLAKTFKSVLDELDEAKAQGNEDVKVMELEFELQKLRNEVKCMENEVVRDKFQALQERRRLQLHPEGQMACLVLAEDQKFSQLQSLLSAMQPHLEENHCVRSFSDCSEAIKVCLKDDVLALSQGEHVIDSLGPLEQGGKIIGSEDGETRVFCLSVAKRSQVELINVDLVSP